MQKAFTFSVLDSVITDFVTTCQQSAMFNKIYNSKTKTDTLGKENAIQDYCFFGTPDEIIEPSEFLEMPNLEDIVTNIVRNAKYKVTEDQSSILVVDKLANQFWDGVALFPRWRGFVIRAGTNRLRW